MRACTRDGRGTLRAVVAAVHFYGTTTDQLKLLDYLGEPGQVKLGPWPVVESSARPLTRQDALARPHVLVVNHALGQPSLVRPGDDAMSEPSRSGLFNRLNWGRLKPEPADALVDSNTSPVLLWAPAMQNDENLRSGHIGSQADSMKAVSIEYERWVSRVMDWVRRRGTKVWGPETKGIRPDLNIRRSDVTTVFALPDALAVLEAGAVGL